MAFDPSRLYSALLNTGLQVKDNPLYQVIYQLINAVAKLFSTVFGLSSSSGGGLVNQSYVTTDNDIAILPNSHQIIAGSNVILSTIPGRVTVSAVIPTPITNNISLAGSELRSQNVDLIHYGRNGKFILEDDFTDEQVGAPVIIVEAGSPDNEMGIVQFSGEIVDTKHMKVFWQSMFGAPSKTRVNYIIGV